jgi:hypothetical protein
VILEIDAILGVVLVVFVRTDPLVIDVGELLLQVCPSLVTLLHTFLCVDHPGHAKGQNQKHDTKFRHLDSPRLGKHAGIVSGGYFFMLFG